MRSARAALPVVLLFLAAAGAYAGNCPQGYWEDANGACSWMGQGDSPRTVSGGDSATIPPGEHDKSLQGPPPPPPKPKKAPVPPRDPGAPLTGGLAEPPSATPQIATDDGRTPASEARAPAPPAEEPAAEDAPAPDSSARPASARVQAAVGRPSAATAGFSLDKAVNELVAMPLPSSGKHQRYRELLGAGQTALRMGDPDAASRELEKAVRLDPDDPSGWIALSQAHGAAKRLAEAETAAAQAVRLAPKSADAWDQQAWVLLKQGRYAQAAEAASRALALDGNDAFAYAVRARARSALGDAAGALADAEAAARLDARFQALAEALRSGRDLGDDSDLAAEAGRVGGRRGGALPWRLAAAALLAALLGWRLLARGSSKKARTFSSLLPGRREGLIGGKYEIKELIGSGGMGQVFDALDHSLGRHVAIKKISGEATRDPQARRRFVAEAQAVAAVSHPNIVSIYEALEEGEQIYLVFERVAGITVERLLLDRPRLSPQETLAILSPVASALAFAHERGLVHRDLKPANIMVADDGFIKLMDFGVARSLPAAGGQAMTQTIAGTPYFMAPEMLDGVVSREGDVYALAVTAYRMLTGAYPFQSWEEKRSSALVVPSARWAGLPASLDELMARALHPDLSRRLKTPAEFIGGLQAAARPERTPPLAPAS